MDLRENRGCDSQRWRELIKKKSFEESLGFELIFFFFLILNYYQLNYLSFFML